MYNFVVTIPFLAYQSLCVVDFREIKGGYVERINELVEFHIYDYGFQITSRSSFIEIIIFMKYLTQSQCFLLGVFFLVLAYLMGNSEDGKFVKTKRPSLPVTTDETNQINQPNIHVYPDWAAMQAYYGFYNQHHHHLHFVMATKS